MLELDELPRLIYDDGNDQLRRTAWQRITFFQGTLLADLPCNTEWPLANFDSQLAVWILRVGRSFGKRDHWIFFFAAAAVLSGKNKRIAVLGSSMI